MLSTLWKQSSSTRCTLAAFSTRPTQRSWTLHAVSGLSQSRSSSSVTAISSPSPAATFSTSPSPVIATEVPATSTFRRLESLVQSAKMQFASWEPKSASSKADAANSDAPSAPKPEGVILYERNGKAQHFTVLAYLWCGILGSQAMSVPGLIEQGVFGMGEYFWYPVVALEGVMALGFINFFAKRTITRIALPDSDTFPDNMILSAPSLVYGTRKYEVPLQKVVGILDAEKQFLNTATDVELTIQGMPGTRFIAKKGQFYHLPIASRVLNTPLGRFVDDAAETQSSSSSSSSRKDKSKK